MKKITYKKLLNYFETNRVQVIAGAAVFVIALLFIIPSAYLFTSETGVENKYEDVAKAIENSNYCKNDSDCVRIDPGCNFGCDWAYVNKNAVGKLSSDIKSYRLYAGKCAADCAPAYKDSPLVCVGNSCAEASIYISKIVDISPSGGGDYWKQYSEYNKKKEK